jgi:tetratricopeptide (TPR) repeat protein
MDKQPLELFRRASAIDAEQPEEAIRLYAQAIKLDPQFAEAMSNLGLVHHRRGDLALAEQWFEKAISIDSRVPDAWYNLGCIRLAQQNLKKAAWLFEQAIEISLKVFGDGNPDAHFNLAETYLSLYHRGGAGRGNSTDKAKARDHYRQHVMLGGRFRKVALQRIGLRVIQGGRSKPRHTGA